MLLKGIPGEAYNISNRNSVITIREMAEIIARKANVSLYFELPDEKEQQAFNPMDNSSLNAGKLESLGWKCCFDAETGFCHAIDILKSFVPKEIF